MKKLLIKCAFLFICFGLFSQNGNNIDSHFLQSTYVKPKKIIDKGQGKYLIDFGKDAFGTLSLKFNSNQSDSVVVHLGEKLSNHNTVDTNPGGTIRYQKIVLSTIPVKEAFSVKLHPDNRNDRFPAILLPDTFETIMPFRYCEIENLKVPISGIEISQKTYHYRFDDDASYFESSDTILNQIWDMCKYTMKATSFCGHYIDGDRERIPYEADALINQLSHYSVDNEYSLARRTNEYFIDHPTWPTEWILHTVPLFYYDYLYTGDLSSVSKHYPDLKNKTLMALEREDGLISTHSPLITDELMKSIGFNVNRKRIDDIVDWPQNERDGYEMVAVNTVVNSFYYWNLKLMSILAGALEKQEDSVFYYNKAMQVREVMNEKLFDRSTGLYFDGIGSNHASLHANMFPLAFGIVPPEKVDGVAAFIKSRGMACSVYGAQYLLEALYKNEEADYALSLMNSTTGDRNWWNMIQVGSTIAMEAWDMKYKPNLDWNHAWGAAPANIITRHLWGITPSSPGFNKISIRPQMSGLTFSKIKVPTVKGPVIAEFQIKENDYEIYIIDIPESTVGEFVIKNAKKERVSLNNKKVKTDDGILHLKPGKNKIEIKN